MKPKHSLSRVINNIRRLFLILCTALLGFNNAFSQEIELDCFDFIDSTQIPLRKYESSPVDETKYVRFIYLIPADSIEKQEYTLGLENAARHLQNWYYNSLGLNRTFALQDPIVEVYKTSHDANWYSTNPNGSYYMTFWNNILQDGFLLTGGMYNDPNNRWVFYIDANPGCGQCGGCGWKGTVVIGANDLKGLVGYEIDKSCPEVVYSYEPCRYVGGMGHEIGHALGLPHPPECDENFPTCWDHDLMMYGYRTYPDAYFNESDKTRLSNSPFIQNIDIEGLYFPNSCMELVDTCNFNTHSAISIFYGDSILLEGKYQKTSGTYTDTLNSVADCDTIITTYLSIKIPPPEAEDVSICEGEAPVLTAEGENIAWYSVSTNPSTDLYDSRDGQTYNTVVIGDQIWMAENLNYYTSSGSWYYDNDSISHSETYGRLYDWESAQNICPLGWHLPDDADWQELIDYLGGNEVAGGKIKEPGYDHWDPPNTDASNTSGFTALPAGKKDFEGDFHHLGYYTRFWSKSQFHTEWGNTYEVKSNSEEIFTNWIKIETAFSVRCMRDSIVLVGNGNSYTPDYDSPGIYTYYVTQTILGEESSPDTVILTINEIPTEPTRNDSAICDGDSVYAEGSYRTLTGTYYDTLQTIHGCDSVIITELNVYPAFETNTTEEICEGDSIMLGGELQTTSGTYYDMLLTQHGCDSIILTELIVNTLPNVYLGNDTIITTNDTIVLDAGAGYIDYLWSGGSNEKTITMYDLSVGDHEYSVWVKSSDNCAGSDTIILHVVLPGSLSDVAIFSDLEIFPNPTSDFLIVKSNTHIKTDFIITLIDNSGKVVFERKIEKLETKNEIVLDLLNLNNGFYILRINNTELIKIHKIIKQ